MRKFIIILIAAVVAVSLIGCGKSVQERISEKIVEEVIEKSSEGNVDVDIDGDSVKIETKDGSMEIESDDDNVVVKDEEGNVILAGGDEAEWPDSLPATVPEFKGELDSFMTMDESNVILVFNNVELEVIEEYVEKLEKAGYTEQMKFDMDESLMYTYQLNEEVTVQLNYDGDAKELMLSVITDAD